MKPIVLITGANSGMGKALSIALAQEQYHVVMLCRNETRGREAHEEVIQKSSSTDVDLMLCDLASMASIHQFAEDFKQRYSNLHILINNAGVITPKRQTSEDGFELQFAVNHLGHFLLTGLLLPLLTASAPARVINVSSGAHKVGIINFRDLQLEKSYTLIKAYSQSKLANILFTKEFARRYENSGITMNALHPGAVATNMGVDRETGFGQQITRLLKPFFLTPEGGAKTGIYLATSEEVASINGEYFYHQKIAKTGTLATNRMLQRRLWQISEELTGFHYN